MKDFIIRTGDKLIVTDYNHISSNQEYNRPHYKNNLSKNIDSENDPFFRGKLTKVSIHDEYPEQVLEKITKYYNS